MEDENWTTIPAEIKKVRGLLSNFEDKLQERKEKFRPIDI